MPVPPRLRRLTTAALPALAAVALTACNNSAYPNSIFHSHTEFNRDVGDLFEDPHLSGDRRLHLRRGDPALRDLPLPAAERERSPRARAREHDARDPVDGDPGADPRVHRRPDRPHDLQDAGEGEGRRAAGRGDRAPVVVGVPLPAVQGHDGERAVPADRPHGELHAQDAGRAALVLDPAARRQARPDHEPHELPLVHAGLASASRRGTACVSSTAARRTRTCASRRSR